MLNKQKDLEKASSDLMDNLQAITLLSNEEIVSMMRLLMDKKELQMFDLAYFCEQETLKAQEVGAHLAACLMCASMNEALLALMCLKYESEVVKTNQYKFSTRKKKRSLREVIGDWKFEQFIKVAEELEWIPANIVNDEIKTALADGYRELMQVAQPQMSELVVEQGAASFFNFPGTAMLRMTQDLRNFVHAGRWMRSKAAFVPQHFMQWCRFATILGGEIRMCLLKLIMDVEMRKASDQLAKVSEMLSELPPDHTRLFQEQIGHILHDKSSVLKHS